METATFVKDLKGWLGIAKLYKLSKSVKFDIPYAEDDLPAKETSFVIVSSAVSMVTGPETFVFPADEEGKVMSWGELKGSFRGNPDHKKALRRAGYKMIGGK